MTVAMKSIRAAMLKTKLKIKDTEVPSESVLTVEKVAQQSYWQYLHGENFTNFYFCVSVPAQFVAQFTIRHGRPFGNFTAMPPQLDHVTTDRCE